MFLLSAGRRTSWVCKVYPEDAEHPLREAVRTGVEVAERLAGESHGIRIPNVIRTGDGDVLARAGDSLLQIQEFLPGAHVPLNLLGSDALTRLGRMLAVLHALQVDAPDRDHTHVPGAAASRTLAEADQCLPDAGFGSVLADVDRLWRETESVIEAAGAEIARTVTVHGDVVKTNVLRHDSAVALIDWDGTHRAPREYEFGTIALDAPEALFAVVRGYCRESRVGLNGDLVVAHAARYLLFGLSFHLVRTLSRTHNAVQRRHDLREAQRYARICQNWPRVEAAVHAATTVQRRKST